VRILFAFTGGRGHVEPLLPPAEAARAAGHAVAFAGRPSILPVVEERGFEAFPAEPPRKPPQRIPLQELDPEREARDFRDGFADRLAHQRAPLVAALCDDWRPDVVVCDETDFGAMVAAESLGVPYASVVTIAAATFAWPELIAEPLGRLRAEHGLQPDPALAFLSRHLVLAPFPPSYRDPASPLPPTARCFRPFDPPPERHDETTTVYFTLGTVKNADARDFATGLNALEGYDGTVIATTGRPLDTDQLTPLPANALVEEFVPQAAVLERADLLVSHSGSGTMIGGLVHGVPQVALPRGTDQPENAALLVRAGAGLLVAPEDYAVGSISAAVTQVTGDPAFRAAAGRVRDEIAAMPDADAAWAALTF